MLISREVKACTTTHW